MDNEERMVEGTAETQRPSAANVGGAEFSFFLVQSYWGATKHMGGFKSTQELVQMCQIAPGKPILELGCGVGIVSWWLAKEYGCYIIVLIYLKI